MTDTSITGLRVVVMVTLLLAVGSLTHAGDLAISPALLAQHESEVKLVHADQGVVALKSPDEGKQCSVPDRTFTAEHQQQSIVCFLGAVQTVCSCQLNCTNVCGADHRLQTTCAAFACTVQVSVDGVVKARRVNSGETK